MEGVSIILWFLLTASASLWLGAFLTGAIALFRMFKLNGVLLDRMSYARWTLALFLLGAVAIAWVTKTHQSVEQATKIGTLALAYRPAWLIVSLWAIGFIYYLFKLLCDLVSLKRFEHSIAFFSLDPRALSLHPDDLIRVRSFKIRFATYTGTASPFTFGFRRPVIVLPEEFETRFRVAERRALLLHEIAHIQRRDYLIFSILLVFRAAFWFNPFYTYLANLYADGVSCIDGSVSSRMSGRPSQTYQ